MQLPATGAKLSSIDRGTGPTEGRRGLIRLGREENEIRDVVSGDRDCEEMSRCDVRTGEQIASLLLSDVLMCVVCVLLCFLCVLLAERPSCNSQR